MPRLKRQLPRLHPSAYRGLAYVFWTHTMEDRARGWLDADFHSTFREILLHACARYHLACPVYCLMPDHFHLLWIGAANGSDQLRASVFLRRRLRPGLSPVRFQRQPHDHVLREEERKRDRFVDTCDYIRRNPVRAGLVELPGHWPYAGALVPGYPDLDWGSDVFWDRFWRCYRRYAEALSSSKPL